MPKNSILSDSTVTAVPDPKKADNANKEQSEFAELGKSKGWKKIEAELDNRIQHYQKNLPNGTPVENLTLEERAARWETAVTLIREIEGFKALINTHAKRDES